MIRSTGLVSMSQQQTQELRHMNPGGQDNASPSHELDATDTDKASPVPSVLPSPPGNREFWEHVAAQRSEMNNDEPEGYDVPILMKAPDAHTRDLITLNELDSAS